MRIAQQTDDHNSTSISADGSIPGHRLEQWNDSLVSAEKHKLSERRTIISLLMGVNRIFCHAYHRLTVLSPPKLPRTGAAILVCNHISGLDPLMIQSVVPRRIVWMMAREFYEIRALRWGFELIDAIPVERSGRDSSALRAALRVLGQGQVLGIFPEGRIEPDGNLLPFQTGVALMAIRTGVEIYPAYLDGNTRGLEVAQAIVRPARCVIAFGNNVKFERSSTSRETLELATRSIESAVAQLRVNNLDKISRL